MDRNNFNHIAFIYDPLARLVFGGSLLRAQQHYLNRIGANSRILIVGGGTGQILNELDELHLPLSVTYVEASSVMIRKAKSRKPFQHLNVGFIQGRADTLGNCATFDVVITNFLLDLFRESYLSRLMECLSGYLKPNGTWLCTDFARTSKGRHRMLMQLMYWFFRAVAGVEGRKLLDFDAFFKKTGFLPVEEQCFYSGMIKSWIYKKPCTHRVTD